jgi:hypothetical protein
MHCDFFAIGNEFLITIHMNFMLQRINAALRINIKHFNPLMASAP